MDIRKTTRELKGILQAELTSNLARAWLSSHTVGDPVKKGISS